MARSGINMESVKIRNRAEILRLIHQTGPISKKDIAQTLGLTPAAVTQICSDMFEDGLLTQIGLCAGESGKAGRKKVLIDLNPEYGYLYSIHIDSAVTTISLCDIRGARKAYTTMETNAAILPEEFLGQVADSCKMLVKNGQHRILGAGVGIPGRVDREAGISLHAYGIWKNPVPVQKILGEKLQTDVRVENNVNTFATAELLFGEGKVTPDLLLVKWGPGVGASIIHNGRIYKSRSGRAAELGHFIVEPDGMPCNCGRRGCLETVISQKALKGKSESEKAQAITLFAQALVNAIALTEPQKVVLCGELFSDAGMQKSLIAACSRLDAKCDEQKIAPSLLMAQENYIGPAAYFIDGYLFGR